jgi:hypothetical protein
MCAALNCTDSSNDKAAKTARARPAHRTLELDTKHELKLARQAGARVWGSFIVVVVVEVVGRGDEPEASLRC